MPRTAWLDIGFVYYVVLLEIRTKGQEIPRPEGCDISEHERQAGRDRQWLKEAYLNYEEKEVLETLRLGGDIIIIHRKKICPKKQHDVL